MQTYKTIQNEVLRIAVDQIRDFYRSCLHRCSYFSFVTNKATSHGKEILSVCRIKRTLYTQNKFDHVSFT